MDGSSTTQSSTPERDHLLYHLGHAYRFLLLGDARASCYHLLKFGSREICRAFLDALAQDLAMRHRLWLETLYWAAYFGEGVGHDYLGWLTEQVLTGRLGLYEAVCSGPPRGEPKPPDEKQVRAAVSAVLDVPPMTSVPKSILQIITGFDLITDEPVSRMGELGGMALGVVGGKALLKLARKAGQTPPKKNASSAQKGVYGEARAKAYISEEHPNLSKLGRDKGVFENGIDGVYKNATPPPDYVLVEAKYNKASLGYTRDGKQTSDGWLQGEKTGFDRIMDAAGEPEADKIKDAMAGDRVEKWLLRTDEQGNVSKRLLDGAGNLIRESRPAP